MRPAHKADPFSRMPPALKAGPIQRDAAYVTCTARRSWRQDERRGATGVREHRPAVAPPGALLVPGLAIWTHETGGQGVPPGPVAGPSIFFPLVAAQPGLGPLRAPAPAQPRRFPAARPR